MPSLKSILFALVTKGFSPFPFISCGEKTRGISPVSVMETNIVFQVCGHHCSETPETLPAWCTAVLDPFLAHIAKESEGILGMLWGVHVSCCSRKSLLLMQPTYLRLLFNLQLKPGARWTWSRRLQLRKDWSHVAQQALFLPDTSAVDDFIFPHELAVKMHIWPVSLSNLVKGTRSLDKEERNCWLIGSPFLKIKGKLYGITWHKGPWAGVSLDSPGFGDVWLSNLSPAGSYKNTAKWFWLLLGGEERENIFKSLFRTQ